MTRARSSKPLLSAGATVGVVATGFAVRRSALEAGIEALREMGFHPRLGRHVLDREGYLAGDDEARAADLAAMLRDEEVRAVWFARGGYGTARILDRVPWTALRSDPKPLIGYSDLTALFNTALCRGARRCLYAPVVTELGDVAAFHGPSLRRALAGEPAVLRFGKRQVLAAGSGRGQLLGGNLSVLAHLWGTRFAPDLRGAVLLLEEVGEEAYRVDRMLTQLRTAGAFRRLEAVLLGGFDVPRRKRFPPDRSLDDLLRESFCALGIPVIRGLPVGHVAGKWTVPLGGTVRVDTRAGQVRFEP